ncbi:MAG: hypothetical protein RKU31_30320 [Deltaproteobacteria bacterium]|jgi:tetratricopeptide (TPR) repeat protein
MRQRMVYAVFALHATAACTNPQPDAQPLVAPKPEAPPLVRLALDVKVDASTDAATSAAGIVAALVELGLVDLPGVVPVIANSTVAPSLGLARDPSTVKYRGRLEVRLDAERIRAVVTMCRSGTSDCAEHHADSARERPDLVAASIMNALAARFDRTVNEAVAQGWSRALSKDPYAVVVAGRAAARWYGLSGAPAIEPRPEDVRNDPFARAVFLDPQLAVAQWMLARSRVARGDLKAAAAALEMARRVEPQRVAFAADFAVLAAPAGRDPAPAWTDLERSAPADLRFTLARAETDLALARGRDVVSRLDAAPERIRNVAEALRLRVLALEQLGATVDDALLEAWALSAPSDPEPIRRRLRREVEARAYDAAFESARELDRRGVHEEALRAMMAAALAAGRYADAAEAARAVGDPSTAARIELRGRLERGEVVLYDAVEGSDRSALLARGALALEGGEHPEAVRAASMLLAREPWDPRALELLVHAARAQGDTNLAESSLRRLMLADPERADRARGQHRGR